MPLQRLDVDFHQTATCAFSVRWTAAVSLSPNFPKTLREKTRHANGARDVSGLKWNGDEPCCTVDSLRWIEPSSCTRQVRKNTHSESGGTASVKERWLPPDVHLYVRRAAVDYACNCLPHSIRVCWLGVSVSADERDLVLNNIIVTSYKFDIYFFDIHISRHLFYHVFMLAKEFFVIQFSSVISNWCFVYSFINFSTFCIFYWNFIKIQLFLNKF